MGCRALQPPALTVATEWPPAVAAMVVPPVTLPGMCGSSCRHACMHAWRLAAVAGGISSACGRRKPGERQLSCPVQLSWAAAGDLLVW